MTEVQSSPREPLFLKITNRQRYDEQQAFTDRMLSLAKTMTPSATTAMIMEFHYRRPVPLPLAALHGWHIRPFWRDMKETPPLPLVDERGRVYKPKAPPPLLLRDPLKIY